MKNFIKKHIIAIMLISLVVSVGLLTVADARNSEIRGDNVVTSTESEDNVMAQVVLENIALATSSVLVDLSDNLNLRHVAGLGGSINVSEIRMSFMALEFATATVKVGVISSSTPAGDLVDVDYFHTFEYSYVDDGYAHEEVFALSPSLMKLAVSSATTTKFRTNDLSTSTSNFATTTALTSPRGLFSAFPGVGDLVVRVTSVNGSVTITPTAIYHTQN